MHILLFIAGVVMVGLSWSLETDFRVVVFVEGMIIINHALLNGRKKNPFT